MNCSLRLTTDPIDEFSYEHPAGIVNVYFDREDRRILIDMFAVPLTEEVPLLELKHSIAAYYCGKEISIAPRRYELSDSDGKVVDEGDVNGKDGLVERLRTGKPLVDHIGGMIMSPLSSRLESGLVAEFVYRREKTNDEEVVNIYLKVDHEGKVLDRVDRFPLPPADPVPVKELRHSVVSHYLSKELPTTTTLRYVISDPDGTVIDEGDVNDVNGQGLIRRFLDGESLDEQL